MATPETDLASNRPPYYGAERGDSRYPPHDVADVVGEAARGQVDVPGRSTPGESGHQDAAFEYEAGVYSETASRARKPSSAYSVKY